MSFERVSLVIKSLSFLVQKLYMYSQMYKLITDSQDKINIPKVIRWPEGHNNCMNCFSWTRFPYSLFSYKDYQTKRQMNGQTNITVTPDTKSWQSGGTHTMASSCRPVGNLPCVSPDDAGDWGSQSSPQGKRSLSYWKDWCYTLHTPSHGIYALRGLSHWTSSWGNECTSQLLW